MTFEEFLAKKKIDLAQFQKAEPALYLEFQSHYSLMGAKSFDHSKKFLFNKLRRAYHLKEEPKPVPTKEVIEVNEIASQAEPLLSPTLEATVYTPRFRAGTSGKKDVVESRPQGSDQAKAAYTPRFKPQPTKSVGDNPAAETPVAGTEPATPTFKPRFRPGLTGATEVNPDKVPQEEIAADKQKPAYVPRFKAPAAAKPAEEVKPVEELDLVKETNEDVPDKPRSAYVPRFKSSLAVKPPEETNDDETKGKP